MARRIPETYLLEIEAIVSRLGGGVTTGQIASELAATMPRRTLNYRLKHLVNARRLDQESSGRWAKYSMPSAPPPRRVIAAEASIAPQGELFVRLSERGGDIQRYVTQPLEDRDPVGYNRKFLDSYRANATAYLSEQERAHLQRIGKPDIGVQPAGTYAKNIMNRLLIDLSWNSSRLEGNTYSLLDTKHLFETGNAADGKAQFDAQMILNHKDAIEFLVESAEEIRCNRYTIFNLHAALANNLLADPDAVGRIRQIDVGIEGSAFEPLAVPQLIDECFDQLLATADAINDPFEQALFMMVHLPYLQPFDDVNKRVSRLAANIPLIRENLSPLSFTSVPRETYTQAILGVYELNDVSLLKDVFIWAYEKSSARYAAVRQSLGEPDPFRLRYQTKIREVIADIIRRPLSKTEAGPFLQEWIATHIADEDAPQFREITEIELLSLREGNSARYRIRLAEFQAWQAVWNRS